jgi:hypothetical protein
MPASTELFRVEFTTAMDDADLARLSRALDLSTRLRSSMKLPEDSLGVARLNESSGLFLRRSATEGRWLLVGQSWGTPPPDLVHQWQISAAVGAQQLDATVVLAQPLPVVAGPEIRDITVGRAAQKQRGRIRRHLAGLTGIDHITPKQRQNHG